MSSLRKFFWSSRTDWSTRPGKLLLTQAEWQAIANCVQLTSRETEVCQLLLHEQTRAENAEQLGIKTRTVRHYVEQIHQKLDVKNRIGVALRVIQIRDELRSGNW